MERTLKKKIRSASATAAVLIFFLMSIVSWFMGVSPGTASVRACAGAVITYFMFSLAGSITANIIINEMVENKCRKLAEKDDI